MKNEGAIDRALRIIVGGALVGLTVAGPWKEMLSPWGYIGLVPLITGIIGFCPLYSLIGLNTDKKDGGASA